jgi:AraC-like DNA-binding protein
MKVIPFTIPIAKENSVIVQEEKQAYFYNHLHRHNEAQITWILEGEGTLIIENYMQQFRAGEIYVIGANTPHIFKSDPAYFEKDSKLSVHAITIFFDPNGILKPMFDFPEMKEIKRFMENMTSLGLQAPAEYINEIMDKIRAVQNSNGGFRIARFVELFQFLSEIQSWKILTTAASSFSLSDSEGIRMNNIYQFTMENYAENIKLKQVADVAFLTPEAFCRYFKKHTRKTYVNFLNEIRINEACKKIFAGEFDTVASVAYDSGFKSAISFNRVFKQITGKTPLQYRNEITSQ